MFAALPFDKRGQRALLLAALGLLFLVALVLGVDGSPTGLEYLLAAHLEGYPVYLSEHGGRGEAAVGVEHADEAFGHEVEHVAFHIRQARGRHPGGNDGVVVGHLRRVEHLLALGQLLPPERFHEFGVGGHAAKRGLVDAVQDARALGIDVVGEILRVHTRIGGHLLFVEALDEFERHVGRVGKLPVALHLQRREVVEMGRCLGAPLLLHVGHGKRFAGNGGEGLLALLLARELARSGRKRRVAVDGGQHPVGFRLEVVYLLLPVHDECQRGGLHPPDGQHLPVLPVFQRVEPCGVHAQYPVADGPRESCEIEALVFALVFERIEPLADGLVGHRRNPQPLHRTGGFGFLHHPPLDEFSLLSRVAAVHDAVGRLHEPFDGGKLLADALVVDEFDAKPLRNHGQGTEAPPLPHRGVVVGLLQLTQVSEGPRHLVAVALDISVPARRCADDAGDVLRHAGLLCNANYHASSN